MLLFVILSLITTNAIVTNAENNNGADIDQLWINKIFVNSGPIMKRFKARARGSADRILKRTCHLTINLSDQ